ncbi:transthyretin domain protein [Phialemonium atrogriseum]|uniref:5-hydroxyisourate hydrolase n=1 Tax=Phialemonium atrogriseum TaxID=1093897 RepID=A0AAJ0C9M1_9PEZI|nr:transthyretin domain protein [Phialemonium atrogriseum]KAK1771247.1 transthyretin domain protein [Phialemonium atrogriseum]
MATTDEAKDRITCHVLDTSTGKPARGIRVKLELSPTAPPTPGGGLHANLGAGHGSAPRVFESQTDDDGRIKVWLPYSSPTSSGEVPVYTLDDVLGDLAGPSRWTLRFDTAAYFGGDDATFFPEVAVVFRVDDGQRYHVPLLLSPYGYSTYRGS